MKLVKNCPFISIMTDLPLRVEGRSQLHSSSSAMHYLILPYCITFIVYIIACAQDTTFELNICVLKKNWKIFTD